MLVTALAGVALLSLNTASPGERLQTALAGADSLSQLWSTPPVPSAESPLTRPFLRSRFAGSLNATHPLGDYPRPQLQRPRWHSLNGMWEWQEARTKLAVGSSLNRRVRVPFPVESELSGLGFGGGFGGATRHRYRRAFELPHSWGWPSRCTVRLHFAAVDWTAVVYVNGRRVAAHAGGFTPFSVDIDTALRGGGPAGPRSGSHARPADAARRHWIEASHAEPRLTSQPC